MQNQQKLLEYIQSMFDEPEYSDFVILFDNNINIQTDDLTDNNTDIIDISSLPEEGKLYLNKSILVSNTFFKQYFGLPIDHDKKFMKVESLKAANDLSWYIYGGQFEPNINDIEELLDIMELAELWMMPDEVNDYLFHYFWDNFVKIITNITEANMAYIYLYKYIMVQQRFSDLVNKLCSFVHANKENITTDMFDWPLVKMLDPTDIIELIVKNNAFERLNDFDFPSHTKFRSIITKYYHQNWNILSPNALFAIHRAEYITKKKTDIPILSNFSSYLLVEIFSPFKAILYTLLGTIHDKIESDGTILIKPLITINKNDVLYIDRTIYEIKDICWNGTPLDTALPGNIYAITFKDSVNLPNTQVSAHLVEQIY